MKNSSKKNVHVVPHDDGWATRTEGSSRVGRTFDTQEQARVSGRDQAIRNSSELFIHGRNGQIRDRDSYGNDPFPPHDTKF